MRHRWQDPDAQRYGRSGQGQQGVDIYSTREGVRVAQCKNMETISEGDLRTEVANAAEFPHAIEAYYLLLSGPRDNKLQIIVDRLSVDQNLCKFSVHVLFWEDIVHCLAHDEAALMRHWPEQYPRGGSKLQEAETAEQFRARVFGYDDDVLLYAHPGWWVEQPSGPGGTRAPLFRVRCYSSSLQAGAFEPSEEEAFLRTIANRFNESSLSAIPGDGGQALIEHRADELRFHRQWGWDARGCLGMVVTLRDLYRGESYSVPELILDLARLFAVVRERAEGAQVFVVAQLEPQGLEPHWERSGRAAPLGGGLRGIRSTSDQWVKKECTVTDEAELPSSSAALVERAAGIWALLLRGGHHVRIEKADFVASAVSLVGHEQLVEQLPGNEGGEGGVAVAEEGGVAIGGDGGDAGALASGGRGGDAAALGQGSVAVGGKGGRGGVVPGMDGGSVVADPPKGALYYAAYGGNGGEAPQPGGRGGRGADGLLAHLQDLRLPDGRRLQDFGKGGDGGHSAEYATRLARITALSQEYGDPIRSACEPSSVPVEWLNARLTEQGADFSVRVVDGCYEFQNN